MKACSPGPARCGYSARVNERGYHAATFQAIAMAAGLSRPTLHYYFASREEIYGMLVADASGVIADCIGEAKRKDTFLGNWPL